MPPRGIDSPRRSRTLSTAFVGVNSGPTKTTLNLPRLRSAAIVAAACAAILVLAVHALGRSGAESKSNAWSNITAANGGGELRETGRLQAHWRDKWKQPLAFRPDIPEAGSFRPLSSHENGGPLDEPDRTINLAEARLRRHGFLPLKCDASTINSFSASLGLDSPSAADNEKGELSEMDQAALDASVLFPGTGRDVRRVLKRAMRSHLYGRQRAAEAARKGAAAPTDARHDGEEPFRILVLGGSVSNCRGVDADSTCWHSHVLRWFQRVLPMEGDRATVIPNERHAGLDDADTPSGEPVHHGQPHPHLRQKRSRSPARRRPATVLIDGSRSATGSAFYAYCFEEEMTLRRKNVDWGKGPDLIVVETGVNDVWPGGEQAMRDYERLLRTLKALPSRPAVIALEAASLLLASTSGAHLNPEYQHLPAAHFYDVPVLSAKNALFGSSPIHSNRRASAVNGYFLPDLHHPNEGGHAILAEILTSYLAQQACRAQAEVLAAARKRTQTHGNYASRQTDMDGSRNAVERMAEPTTVDPAKDFSKRKDEDALALPTRSLFQPYFYTKKKGKNAPKPLAPWVMPPSECLQIGNARSSTKPVRNAGWKKMAWSRDKQYLVADRPGAAVTFSVDVGEGGTVMADWLRSRSYDLGDVSAYLDGNRAQAVQLTGYQDFGWSIGVPTELFRDVAPGVHELTFELLDATRSSHPERRTNFRLISIIST